jgi:DNA polymerase III delta subunit
VRVLRALLSDGEAPLRIVGFVAANLRRRLHVSELREQGLSDDAIGARLGMPPWLVGKQGGSGSARHLERALGLLAELDQALKSSRPDAAVFEQALVRLS